jgi:hypothetical protein
MSSTSPEIKYSNPTAQRILRLSVSEPKQPQHTSYHTPEPRRNSEGQALPEIGLKWGKAAKRDAPPEIKSSGHGNMDTEVARMRSNSISSDLNWGIEHRRGGERKKSTGFWSKVAGSGLGGDVIK